MVSLLSLSSLNMCILFILPSLSIVLSHAFPIPFRNESHFHPVSTDHIHPTIPCSLSDSYALCRLVRTNSNDHSKLDLMRKSTQSNTLCVLITNLKKMEEFIVGMKEDRYYAVVEKLMNAYEFIEVVSIEFLRKNEGLDARRTICRVDESLDFPLDKAIEKCLERIDLRDVVIRKSRKDEELRKLMDEERDDEENGSTVVLSGFQAAGWRLRLKKASEILVSLAIFFLVAPGTFPAAACICAVIIKFYRGYIAAPGDDAEVDIEMDRLGHSRSGRDGKDQDDNDDDVWNDQEEHREKELRSLPRTRVLSAE